MSRLGSEVKARNGSQLLVVGALVEARQSGRRTPPGPAGRRRPGRGTAAAGQPPAMAVAATRSTGAKRAAMFASAVLAYRLIGLRLRL